MCCLKTDSGSGCGRWSIRALVEGDRVDHEHFGRGVVLKVRGSGPRRRAEVRFDRYGVKELVLQFARLTKLA